MKEVEIGASLSKLGLSYFGIDEVNDLLKQGFIIKEVKGGGALLHELESDSSGKKSMALAGFVIKVLFKEPQH